jgi:hypothetical protein
LAEGFFGRTTAGGEHGGCSEGGLCFPAKGEFVNEGHGDLLGCETKEKPDTETDGESSGTGRQATML